MITHSSTCRGLRSRGGHLPYPELHFSIKRRPLCVSE